MKYFLASYHNARWPVTLYFFLTAYAWLDAGLFHFCNTASNKDGKTALSLVIN